MSKIYPLKLYLKHRTVYIPLVLALFMNLAMWGWLLWNIRPQDDAVFLHYNILFGVDLTGPWYMVFSVPTIGLCLILINAFLGWFSYDRDPSVSLFANIISCFVHFFLLIATSILIFLNV